MNSSWEIRFQSQSERSLCKQLAQELSISEISASLLVRRGLLTAADARKFISPKLDMLHDPFLMKDMFQAVQRIHKAITDGESILIFGDYDVDGTTAVALTFTFLSSIIQNSNTKIDYYIPDRYSEGYGISTKGIDYAKQTGSTLIIALDCGIRSINEVEYAKEKGIDFIICDHHLPGETIPKAVAVLNPKREDCQYPFSELCGCGVGFKLVQAYTQKFDVEFQLTTLLPLVAMAIASDIVPIKDENRILAFYGIRMLNSCPTIGIKSLMSIAGIEIGKLTINDLVYKIGPRINACGRIRSGKDAVRLLITTNQEEANSMSETINQQNEVRKGLDQQITNEALEILQSDEQNSIKKSTIVCGENWHKGVVGIVASRLIDSFYRPTIVLTLSDGMISGSARSVGGFDIYSAIDSCSDLLTNFGGHIYAAGLSMKPDKLPAFKQRFEQYVSTHILPQQMRPVIEVETEIAFSDITSQFFNILQHLEPFGPGNPRPIFVTRNVCNYRYTRKVGKNGEHLRLDVTDRTGALQGIAFGKGDYALPLMNGENMDICYELQQNTFNGQTTIQMMVLDIRKAQL